LLNHQQQSYLVGLKWIFSNFLSQQSLRAGKDFYEYLALRNCQSSSGIPLDSKHLQLDQ
jgi:hypothetical protein